MYNKFINIKKQSSGQAMVEFALVAVLLFSLFFGICEFGFAWMQDNTATSAAREGARAAAVTSPFSTATADAAARNALTAAGISPGNIVSITITPPNAQSVIVVTVQIRYNSITGGFIPGMNGIILQGQTRIRWEG